MYLYERVRLCGLVDWQRERIDDSWSGGNSHETMKEDEKEEK